MVHSAESTSFRLEPTYQIKEKSILKCGICIGLVCHCRRNRGGNGGTDGRSGTIGDVVSADQQLQNHHRFDGWHTAHYHRGFGAQLGHLLQRFAVDLHGHRHRTLLPQMCHVPHSASQPAESFHAHRPAWCRRCRRRRTGAQNDHFQQFQLDGRCVSPGRHSYLTPAIVGEESQRIPKHLEKESVPLPGISCFSFAVKWNKLIKMAALTGAFLHDLNVISISNPSFTLIEWIDSLWLNSGVPI